MSNNSVTGTAYENKLREMTDHKASKRARQFDRAARFVIWGATDLVAVTALVLGAWSNQTVARWLGVPGKAGWAAALVIDGIWLVSLAIVQLHRREPWRALSAYQATIAMVALSGVANFAHGLLIFGVNPPWRGIAAGFLFALLPVSLKWLIAVSTRNSMGLLLKAPDAKERIKQAGQLTAELELNQLLNPVIHRVNQTSTPAPALEPPATSEVRLERLEPENDANWVPEWVNSTEPTGQDSVPALEPVRVPVVPPVQPPTNLNDRQARIDDLADWYAEKGGQLGNITFAEMSIRYQIPVAKKSTLSNLRKAGHQAYLNKAQTGPYL